jgi:hypothetical protein
VEIPDRVPKRATPVEIPFDTGKAHPWGDASTQSGGTLVYEALTAGSIFVPTNSASPVDGLPYGEYADDCHLTMGGALQCFTIGYFEPSAPNVDVTVTLYGNDASDGNLLAAVAGPYVFTGLPGGFNVVTLTPPDTPTIPVDVWFAVSFTPDTAGLVNSPAPSPTTGVSHDIFLDTGLTPPPGLVFFGGDPLANFMISIEIVDETVGVEQSSWSAIKTLFRSN